MNFLNDATEVANNHSSVTIEVSTTIDDWNVPENFVLSVDGCEEFALACRDYLKQKGHSPRLALATTRDGNNSLVCLIGKYALAVENDAPQLLIRYFSGDTGNEFIAYSGLVPGEEWTYVDRVDGPTPLGGVNRIVL